MIVFLNTNCPDCRKDLPVIQKIYGDFRSMALVVCISLVYGRSEIEEYWSDNNLPFAIRSRRIEATTDFSHISACRKSVSPVLASQYTISIAVIL